MSVQRGAYTYQEIMSQGQAWEKTLQAFQGQATRLADWLRQPRQNVVFTGCGSTYYLSLAACVNWQALTGERADALPASEIWLFPDATLKPQPSLLVAVSRSGETSETVRALELLRQAGGNALAVTVYAGTSMEKLVPHTLVTSGAEEQSVAQTRSFSSMYVLLQAATALAAGKPRMIERLQALPQRFEQIVKAYEPLARSLAQDQTLQHFVFLGSGANYGLACEAMLKMKEMSLSTSEAFHFMEFRHGPKSVVSANTLVIGLLGDSSRAEELKVLAEMRQLGARTLAICESGEGVQADYLVELSSGLDAVERGALNLPVLQLLGYYRSMEKGLNPDRPPNLDAVVKL
jgi:glucosamine--fructose-6-phosphate aminotransferase (isomerizing)